MAGINPMRILITSDPFELRVMAAVIQRHHELTIQMQDRLAQEVINRLAKAMNK
jgi:hypothetical protein